MSFYDVDAREKLLEQGLNMLYEEFDYHMYSLASTGIET